MSKYFGELSGKLGIATTIGELVTTTLQAMEEINTAELMPWINQAIVSDTRQLPITDLEDIQGATAKIAQNVKNRLEQERPKGYRNSNRGSIFSTIDSQTRTAINNKAQELLSNPSRTMHQDMSTQNKILGSALLEGRIGILEAINTVDKNFERYKKVFPENLHDSLREELYTELTFFALAANADPLSKAQIVEDAAPYISPQSLLKAEQEVQKSFANPSASSITAMTKAIEKVIEERPLTAIENRYLQVQQVQALIQEIRNQDLSGLNQIIADKQEDIRSYLTENYVNAVTPEASKKSRRFYVENALNSGSLVDALSIFISSPRLSRELKDYLQRQLVEVSTVEKRRIFMEKEYLNDSAQIDVRYGLKTVPEIDFTSINSMTEHLPQLQANFDKNEERNIASTFFDEVNMSSFLETMNFSSTQQRYELLSGIQKTIGSNGNKAFINQLATANPVYAAIAESNNLFSSNFSAAAEQSFTDPINNNQEDPDLSSYIGIAYRDEQNIGNVMKQFYSGLPKTSAVKNTIERQINISHGSFIEPIVFIKDEQGNTIKLPVIDTLRTFSTQDLTNLTGTTLNINSIETQNDGVARTKARKLTVGEIRFLTLGNEGGGLYGLYFGNSQYPENRILDAYGRHIKIQDSSLKEALVYVNRKRKNAEFENIFDQNTDGVF